MKIISWNCRGLGNPSAVRALLRLIRIENPQVVFLMETRLKEDEMERIKFKCGFNSGISVACTGSGRERSGGIALFWNDQVTISTISYSVNHILCSCADGDGGANWFLSGVYGFPRNLTNGRHGN
ncbi:hypothetical protein QL285_077521 [Trifolium repens]|nr:hypothetical protein QL285_077521 [Trifolium repens]